MTDREYTIEEFKQLAEKLELDLETTGFFSDQSLKDILNNALQFEYPELEVTSLHVEAEDPKFFQTIYSSSDDKRNGVKLDFKFSFQIKMRGDKPEDINQSHQSDTP